MVTAFADGTKISLEQDLVANALDAEPSPSVFVLAYNDNPEREIYLRYGKLGHGPLYPFRVPHYLTALEVPLSVARSALVPDHAVSSQPRTHRVDVVVCIQRSEVAVDEVLVTIGIREGSRLLRDVPRDRPLTRNDLELPEGRVVIELRREEECALGRHGLRRPV